MLGCLNVTDELRFYRIIILPLPAYEILLRYPCLHLEAVALLVAHVLEEMFWVALDISRLTILMNFLLEGSTAVFLALTLTGISPITDEFVEHFICTDWNSVNFFP